MTLKSILALVDWDWRFAKGNPMVKPPDNPPRMGQMCIYPHDNDDTGHNVHGRTCVPTANFESSRDNWLKLTWEVWKKVEW